MDLGKQYQSLVQNNFKQNELSKQEQIASLSVSSLFSVSSLEFSVSRNSDSQSDTRWSNYDIEKIINFLREIELHQTLELYTPQDKNLQKLHALFMINIQQTRTDAAIKEKLGEIINNISKTYLPRHHLSCQTFLVCLFWLNWDDASILRQKYNRNNQQAQSQFKSQ
ncbi:Hypothetical_protein [Hexamita inflata]|uniref:Hypothetical_protein n=1 Tax=Hexamita inflata TaxID=28002 RepID=A0AA86UNI5_9EUKA|nr:Hypothetical protein HINF_LOCUS46142 [Hexamita inflata]